jgi:hypothetical protein
LAIAAVLFVAAAAPAFAFHCPRDMAAIDAALAANPNVSAENLAKVKDLRSKGEAAHRAGNHQSSVDQLAEAMAILGIGK